MKNVVTVTLGASKNDFALNCEFLGERFHVKRIGTDGDQRKAWDLLRRQQAHADAIGVGDTADPCQVGLRTVVNPQTEKLTKVVTRVPVTTGAPVGASLTLPTGPTAALVRLSAVPLPSVYDTTTRTFVPTSASPSV